MNVHFHMKLTGAAVTGLCLFLYFCQDKYNFESLLATPTWYNACTGSLKEHNNKHATFLSRVSQSTKLVFWPLFSTLVIKDFIHP
jgi:hypothetical protein